MSKNNGIYIILSHYSNESIGEFNSVDVGLKYYRTLEEAKKAAEQAFREDKAIGVDHGEVEPITEDNCDLFDNIPEYCVGEAAVDNFECYHDIYAVFFVEE